MRRNTSEGAAEEAQVERLVHPWEAIFDSQSRVLILGTFPSPKSRAAGYPYGHSQNIFWSTLAWSLGVEALPQGADAEQRREWLLLHRVAVWDVIHSCVISGASDASISDVEPNHFRPIIEASQIVGVFTTGRKATELFNSLCAEEAGLAAGYLPSTSPANRAAQSRDDFLQQWSQVGRQVRGEAQT